MLLAAGPRLMGFSFSGTAHCLLLDPGDTRGAERDECSQGACLTVVETEAGSPRAAAPPESCRSAPARLQVGLVEG